MAVIFILFDFFVYVTSDSYLKECIFEEDDEGNARNNLKFRWQCFTYDLLVVVLT